MTVRVIVGAACVLAVASGCGGGSTPTAPPSPLTSPPGAPASVTGEVRGALDDVPLSGVAIRVDGAVAANSDENGRFTIQHASGRFECEMSGAGFVTRRTALRLPGPHVRASLIPSGFELPAFDQMMRGGGSIHRWTSAPALVVVDHVLQFTSTSADASTALDEALSEDEQQRLVADLSAALEALTVDFGGFGSVSVQAAQPGQPSSVRRDGAIVVARYSGLTGSTGFWGYGRWATRAGGGVVAGIMLLDRDFERSGSPFRASLRSHELGHALGYDHVTLRESVMNSTARLLPNDFDRAAVRIAFQRPPGNATPDNDPGDASINRAPPWAPGALVWRGAP